MADSKVNRRSVFIQRLKEIYDLATAATQNPAKINDFKIRYSALESTYNEFDRLHLDIISDKRVTDVMLEQQELIRAEVDDQYFSIKSIYSELCIKSEISMMSAHGNERSPPNDDVLPSANDSSVDQPHCGTTSINSNSAFTLLATAKVDFLDSQGYSHTVRVLLDSGSQGNFISERCFKKLRLSRSRLNIPINGLGNMTSVSSNGVTCCTVRPVGKNTPSFPIECIVLPQICSYMPSVSFSRENWSHMENLVVSDDTYNTPGPIDALIGCELFPLILLPEKVCGKELEPVAFNTLFGWVVMGKIDRIKSKSSYSCCTLLEENRDINKTLQMFWEMEEVPSSKSSLTLDDPAEISFNETHSRTPEGRFIVTLPFSSGEPLFSDSRSIALKRFYSLERRLLKDPPLFEIYSKFMKEYLELDHMEPVSAPVSDVAQRHFYIPHHGVTNSNSTTTALRVVFDASCSPRDRSLNDTLLIGPKLQNEIVSILLSFRRFPVAFTADITMMYRQILVNDSHQDYQRILWRFSPREPVQDFRLKTVTYGLNSAPFLALRCLLQLATEGRDRFPRAAAILASQVYVDDICVSCKSLEDAVDIKQQLIALLDEGCFFLRKWSSNCVDFLATIPSDILQKPLALDTKSDPYLKVLGLRWSPEKDIFSYDIQFLNSTCTKRSILSEISRIFDPIGLLCPITLLVKQLMQSLWARGIDWDSEVPADIAQRWTDYKNELPSLSALEIPRYCFISKYVSLEFHAFGDASELGYGSCIYSRLVSPDGQISTYLLYAKSKVSPLKRLSLPKLELSAALMASKLLKYALNVYNIPDVQNIYAWSDSTIVLGWIRSPPCRWRTFVSNRVSQIQDNVAPERWFHIKSEDNPADLASRPVLPSDLVDCPLWWAGPAWLSRPSEEWPKHELGELDEPLPEERATILTKILRLITYWRRFLGIRFKVVSVVKKGPFTEYELFQSLLRIVKQVQAEAFYEDISNLSNKSVCSKPLRKLAPFIDEQGLLRVGGRLTHSQLDYDQKHPVLLPNKHRLTDLIIEDFHKRYLHCGQQALRYFISQRFWILGAKGAIKRIVHKCFRCFRTHPQVIEPKMGDLPSFRITQAKPFQCTSLDFGGPFQILMSRHRGCRTQKAYLSLFVCCSTKCLHLELVSDLSTSAFLASLRRFISRRGRCSKLHSDNGTNYVGAARYLADCMAKAAAEELIEWQFFPPSAPHFGGLHEAGIKSFKTHITKIIGEQLLTYEEFYTVLTQVEAVLNSRPLCAMSSDPNDLSSLTPGHFLSLAPLSAIPDHDLTCVPMNRLDWWQLLTKMHQSFWKRWHMEYLHSLQQRAKWDKDTTLITPGTLVVLKEDNLPPLQWRLGWIDSIHPGADGVPRVVTVRTQNGLIKRPVIKVCPLPAN
ncbi:uncharacterized protein LOC132700786 [Cylas formicarius]|uniref:uncharacterized protein LOC132700786 n=1 Tax=Cylas formicarius TaxID=197179 RepID=UPI002958606B|nr:uncharacterized protein LOC132700786 [Cylas formicarius]